MASAIDATKPVAGNPTTESVRLNFAAAKSEIEILQQTAGVGPQGPVGPTGPSGTLTVGTVTTGLAGTSASVTNTGTTQAAVLNFTIPRGDAGTGGSGITETQAKDAVRQGNITFLESPETTGVAFPTTPNLAQPPVVGAGWTPTTGGTATQAYTHDIGDTDPLAYPATIASGTFYQILFSLTNVAATSTALGQFITIYFRNGATNTTGQQLVTQNIAVGTTVTILATSNFTHVAIVPASGWQGNFTLTRVVAFAGAQNSVSFSVKGWTIRVRDTSAYIGGGGSLATNTENVSLGHRALESMTTGSGNVALGSFAMAFSSSASNNIAIGRFALQHNTTGGTNIAIGYYAMQYVTTGSSNTTIGYYANYGQRSGYNTENVSVGRYAMYWGSPSVQCNYNVAVGDWVGFRGNYNTGVGFCAMAYTNGPPGEPTGSYNVAIGYKAGGLQGANANLNAAENSVFLGSHTKAGGDTQTNQVVIGYGALGHGSNTITLGNDAITALHCNVQTISALSDSRVKENVQPANLDTCLNAVKSLPVSEWDWLPISGMHQAKHTTGFMADDVAKIWPQAITKEDRALTVRGADGKPEMTPVPTSTWKPPNDETATPRETPLLQQTEKTAEIKGLQYVSLAEALPTLWGAVQRLIEKNEALEKQLADLKSPTEPSKPTLLGGGARRR